MLVEANNEVLRCIFYFNGSCWSAHTIIATEFLTALPIYMGILEYNESKWSETDSEASYHKPEIED